MRLTDDKKEEIRRSIDLVDVVGDYVRLKKQGRRFVGLCPFHKEKTPSFHVVPEEGFYHCFGCLEADEPVWTGRGLVPIRDVVVGDRVLGIDGQEEIVTEVLPKTGPLLEIELDHVRRDPLRLTPDHTCTFVRAEDALRAVPMLYRQAGRGIRFQSRRRRYETSRPCPIREEPAESLKAGDYFLYPVIDEAERQDDPLPAPRRLLREREPITERVAAAAMPERRMGPAPRTFEGLPVCPVSARLYGLWLAEGSAYRGGVRWSFHRDEAHLAGFVVDALQHRFGLDATVHARPERTLLEVTCSNTHLSYLLPRWFGRGAAGKRVPFEALRWSVPVQTALVDGYLEGDGSAVEASGYSRAMSGSPALVRGLFGVAVQAGMPVAMARETTPTKAGNPVWALARRTRASRSGFFHRLGGVRYYWLRVGRVGVPAGDHDVVDLNVTGTHTFTTRVGATHNCKRSGDLFGFVEEMEGVGFLEAARLLAERAGVDLPEDGAAPDDRATLKESALAVLRFAAKWYYEQLRDTEAGRARGLAYFEERGFTPETITRFGLGYAPDAWGALADAARAASHTTEALEAAGLVLPNKSGDGVHDRFRDRALFPILSHVGKVLGFGGRIIPGGDTGSGDYTPPKYINSPETEVYHKSNVLYGLYHAKRAIRGEETAILVEGYTDVVSLHQAGVQTAVASSGTALTSEQIALLKRYAKTVLLLYDADNAGTAAADRAIDGILEAGLAPYVVALPDGTDPDSFVRQFGGDAFRSALAKHRLDFVAFRVSQARRAGQMETPEGQGAVSDAVVESIRKIRDPIVQNGYLRRAAAELGALEAELRRKLGRSPSARRREPVQERSIGPAPEPLPAVVVMRPEEAALLRLMLDHGAPLVERILGHMGLDEFTAGPPRDLAARLVELYHADRVGRAPFLEGEFGPELQRLAAEVLADRHEVSQNWQRKGVEVPERDAQPLEAAASAMRLLKLDRVDEAIEANRRATFAAEQAGDDVTPFLVERQRLNEARAHVASGQFLEPPGA